MGLGLLHHFSARWWLTVALAALFTRTSEFIPFVVPGIVLAIGGNRSGIPAVWFLTATGFALTTAAIWQGTPGGVLLGVPLFIIGSLLAAPIWRVVGTRPGPA